MVPKIYLHINIVQVAFQHLVTSDQLSIINYFYHERTKPIFESIEHSREIITRFEYNRDPFFPCRNTYFTYFDRESQFYTNIPLTTNTARQARRIFLSWLPPSWRDRSPSLSIRVVRRWGTRVHRRAHSCTKRMGRVYIRSGPGGS